MCWSKHREWFWDLRPSHWKLISAKILDKQPAYNMPQIANACGQSYDGNKTIDLLNQVPCGTTWLMRPHLLYDLFVVSRIAVIGCILRHFWRSHVLDKSCQTSDSPWLLSLLSTPLTGNAAPTPLRAIAALRAFLSPLSTVTWKQLLRHIGAETTQHWTKRQNNTCH